MKAVGATLLATLIMGLASICDLAIAQDTYPAAPIKLTVGFAPGGAVDVLARLMAQKLSTQMNANVFVDNKVGANANIAAEAVAKSKPDGYTLLFNSPGVVLSPALGEKLNYDVQKDLAPVSLAFSVPMVLTVHSSVPVNTVAEFIAYVKANPDKLAYGSAGTGSFTHLSALLFLQLNGLSALHVPYKGAAPALLDAASGRTQIVMQSPVTAVPLVKDKRMKALAVTSLTRWALLPDVPTLNETVMPGFELGSWNGVMAPANTPRAVITKLNQEIVKLLKDGDIKTRLAQEGAQPVGSTADEYGAYLRAELERWNKAIKSAGIKLD